MTQSSSHISYTIDSDDRIVTVGGDWDHFVRESGSPTSLLSDNILGRSFWDFLNGEVLRHVYRRAFSIVRTGTSMEYSFRCDSPAVRRHLKLRMTPIENGGIDFVTETLHTEARDFHHDSDVSPEQVAGLIVACSWCNKIRTSEKIWQEVEDAVGSLALFEKDILPSLSHGMCEYCYAFVMDGIKVL